MTDPNILEEFDAPGKMKYSEHLKELRTRTIYIVGSVLAVFFCLLPFSHQSYAWLATPLVKLLPAQSSMIATDVVSTFLAPFKLNLYIAFLLTIPITLYHIWKFIAPALYQNEKRIGLGLVFGSAGLFFCGILFSYFAILPLALKFFVYASPENVLPMTDINSYLSFCLKLFLAFGFAFQIPILTYVLIFIGILEIETLEQYRRHIIVFFFFVSMFITPPDILSMLSLAVPMCILFEVGLQLSKLKIKK
ncbi:MAG: twin-arginine translocase subunit TatC [Acinetobacter bohemicus]|jgi:sec-independent protein translocase protein TatC